MDPYLAAILLYCAALLLAFVDIFVPSGGMLLILSGVAACSSILFGFRSSTSMGMAMLTLVAASIPVFIYLAVRIWPHTPIGRRMILPPPIYAEKDKPIAGSSLEALVGKTLETETALMPSGQIKLGHRRINAVMLSGIAEAGQRVKVVAVRERSLVVRLSHDPVSNLSWPTESEVAESPGSLLDRPAEELGLDSLEN